MIYRGTFNLTNAGGMNDNILKNFRISRIPLTSGPVSIQFSAIARPTARNTGAGSFNLDPRITGMFIGDMQVIEYAELAYPSTIGSGAFAAGDYQIGPISPYNVLIDGEPGMPGELIQVRVAWSAGAAGETGQIVWLLKAEEVG